MILPLGGRVGERAGAAPRLRRANPVRLRRQRASCIAADIRPGCASPLRMLQPGRLSFDRFAGRHRESPAMARRRQIYEGKAKILYEGPEPGTLIQYFKDDATAFNAQKSGTISGKGVLNNRISEHVFTAARRRSACRPTSSAASTCASS